MILVEKIIEKKEKISLIGLGYVGMPIAIAFSKMASVIGFDTNEEKILLYRNGEDPTGEVGNEEIKNSSCFFTCDPTHLKEALFHIVAVPTPINKDKTPDLSPVINASAILGKNLRKGSIVVYESTVYPGVTEEVCVPILEKESGLKCGLDFKIGYSPERINPGDKMHRLENITKIVSGIDDETCDAIAKVYELVVKVGVYKAESIKVAEAAKVIENCQRDINIAFMNELSIIFNKLEIDTKAVLKAASTKWNFIDFYPGLVGGHCIGVDPYYLTYKAEKIGYHSQVILAGRRINDDMGKHIAQSLVKELAKEGINFKEAKVVILGFTFKENCPDIRNTKVMDVIDELNEYGIMPIVVDPIVDKKEVLKVYGIEVSEIHEVSDVDAVLITVPHREFIVMDRQDIARVFKSNCSNRRIVFDIKGIYDKGNFKDDKYCYWRL